MDKNLEIDIETKIMDCWGITNDLKIINEAILEKDLTKDEINNMLLGVELLYELKFQNLFEEYSKLLKSK